MSRADTHLSADAVVAYVDDELAPTPLRRTIAHLDYCRECRVAVVAQRAAKGALSAIGGPAPSVDFLARLREIPFTDDLGAGPFDADDFGTRDVALAVTGDSFVYAARGAQLVDAAPVPAPVPAVPPVERSWLRPAGTSMTSHPHPHLFRRGLIGAAAAAMVVGALAAAPIASSAGTTPSGDGIGSPGGTAAPTNASFSQVADERLMMRGGPVETASDTSTLVRPR